MPHGLGVQNPQGSQYGTAQVGLDCNSVEQQPGRGTVLRSWVHGPGLRTCAT